MVEQAEQGVGFAELDQRLPPSGLAWETQHGTANCGAVFLWSVDERVLDTLAHHPEVSHTKMVGQGGPAPTLASLRANEGGRSADAANSSSNTIPGVPFGRIAVGSCGGRPRGFRRPRPVRARRSSAEACSRFPPPRRPVGQRPLYPCSRRDANALVGQRTAGDADHDSGRTSTQQHSPTGLRRPASLQGVPSGELRRLVESRAPLDERAGR